MGEDSQAWRVNKFKASLTGTIDRQRSPWLLRAEQLPRRTQGVWSMGAGLGCERWKESADLLP